MRLADSNYHQCARTPSRSLTTAKGSPTMNGGICSDCCLRTATLSLVELYSALYIYIDRECVLFFFPAGSIYGYVLFRLEGNE